MTNFHTRISSETKPHKSAKGTRPATTQRRTTVTSSIHDSWSAPRTRATKTHSLLDTIWVIGTTRYCQPHETNQPALSWGLSVQTPQHGHRHKTAHAHPKSAHNSYATSHHPRKIHCSRGKQPRVRSSIEVHEGTGLDRSATETTNYQRSTHGNPNTYRLIQIPKFASSQPYNYDTPPPYKAQ